MTPYAPFYCEENIWHLAHAGSIDAVVFISNPAQQVAFFAQRQAKTTTDAIMWDYHVIGATFGTVDNAALIWDLDTRLPCPCPAETYLAMTFPALPAKYAHVLPWFRLIPSVEFIAGFASDRRHMRATNGAWLKPPPPWPCIRASSGAVHTLPAFVGMSSAAGNNAALGRVFPAPATEALSAALLR